MTVPCRTLERTLGNRVCGVDEVGRGCLAGTIVAAAVIMPDVTPPFLLGVRDSKKLSEARKVAFHEAILATCLVGLGTASVAEVEGLNPLHATFLAMRRAVASLTELPDHAQVDGNRVPPGLGVPATAVVGGDARCLAVAAASVVAKVTRDRAMRDLALEHPGYGWERNAGYGTPEHLSALSSLGVSIHHRRTFAGVKELLAPQMALAL